MPKAKILTHEERLELTRRKMAFQEMMKMKQSDEVTAAPGAEEHQEQQLHGDTCPFCGRNTLIHESGCVKCIACNWSKCG